MEAIIATAISCVGTLLVCLINNHYQQQQTRTLIEYKIDELAKRVEKHNNVIERVYELEKRAEVVDEQINEVNRRISV